MKWYKFAVQKHIFRDKFCRTIPWVLKNGVYTIFGRHQEQKHRQHKNLKYIYHFQICGELKFLVKYRLDFLCDLFSTIWTSSCSCVTLSVFFRYSSLKIILLFCPSFKFSKKYIFCFRDGSNEPQTRGCNELQNKFCCFFKKNLGKKMRAGKELQNVLRKVRSKVSRTKHLDLKIRSKNYVYKLGLKVRYKN